MNFQLVIDSLTQIGSDIINFIPNLVNGLIILLVGVLIARLVRFVVRFSLERLRFDLLVERMGVTNALRSVGITMKVSTLLAQTMFILLLLSFLITATRLLGLEAVATLLEQLIEFLPQIIASLIIFVMGGMAAQFVGGLVTSALAASGVANAGRVGRAMQYLLSVFVVILALSRLGVDTAMLVTALTITIAAFGLALGLSLGLGARGVVSHIIAGFYLRQRYPTGEQIVMGDVRGAIENIGPVSTELQGELGRVVVPNSVLLEATVQAGERRPSGGL